MAEGPLRQAGPGARSRQGQADARQDAARSPDAALALRLPGFDQSIFGDELLTFGAADERTALRREYTLFFGFNLVGMIIQSGLVAIGKYGFGLNAEHQAGADEVVIDREVGEDAAALGTPPGAGL